MDTHKNLPPQIIAQIYDGITPNQYLAEGLWIMQDVHLMIENLKNGNFNNYVGRQGSLDNTMENQSNELMRQMGSGREDTASIHNQSVAGYSVISKSFKARR